MIGMDRRSGLPLSGLAHLKQSVEDILTTRWAAGACARVRQQAAADGRHAGERRLEKRRAGRGSRSLGRWEPRIGLSAVRVVAVVDGRVDLLLSGVFEGENINMEVSA